MTWLRRRKKDAQDAARRLEEAGRKVADTQARIARLEAEIEIYGPLMKRRGNR